MDAIIPVLIKLKGASAPFLLRKFICEDILGTKRGAVLRSVKGRSQTGQVGVIWGVLAQMQDRVAGPGAGAGVIVAKRGAKDIDGVEKKRCRVIRASRGLEQ